MVGNCLSCPRWIQEALFSKCSFFASWGFSISHETIDFIHKSFSPATPPGLYSRSALSGAPTAKVELMMQNRNGIQTLQFPAQQWGSHQTGLMFPVEVIWDRREGLLPRRQVRLSNKGLAIELRGQPMVIDVKTYAWGYMVRNWFYLWAKKNKARFVGCFNKTPTATLCLKDKGGKLHVASLQSLIDIERCSFSRCDFKNFIKGVVTEVEYRRNIEN